MATDQEIPITWTRHTRGVVYAVLGMDPSRPEDVEAFRRWFRGQLEEFLRTRESWGERSLDGDLIVRTRSGLVARFSTAGRVTSISVLRTQPAPAGGGAGELDAARFRFTPEGATRMGVWI